MQQRLTELGRSLDSLTIVYDKGNVSKANQALMDTAELHYLSALTVASQQKLVEFADSRLDTVHVDGEPVRAYRTRHHIWGKERTVVVVVSQRLLEGQARGVLQQVASAQKWLTQLADLLAPGQQRRERARIQRDIETRLQGRQFLSRVLRVELAGDDPNLRLNHKF
jgi:transposase